MLSAILKSIGILVAILVALTAASLIYDSLQPKTVKYDDTLTSGNSQASAAPEQHKKTNPQASAAPAQQTSPEPEMPRAGDDATFAAAATCWEDVADFDAFIKAGVNHDTEGTQDAHDRALQLPDGTDVHIISEDSWRGLYQVRVLSSGTVCYALIKQFRNIIHHSN